MAHRPLHALLAVSLVRATPGGALRAWGRRWNGWIGAGFLLTSALAWAGSPVDYERDVKPVLRDRCYACHGALKQKANLRLDTVAWMLKGGDSGPVLDPGAPTTSRLMQRIETEDADDRMPPEHEGERLSPAQAALVRAWIGSGATGPSEEVAEADPKDHWAFRPPVRPSVPAVSRPGWSRNAIDAFIAQRHDAEGLVPQDEAPRPVLVRRLYVDLIGVPPTMEDLARDGADQAAGWYERLVDRLLDDPRHGERWARHWMDIWRYSDWWGLGDQLRNSQRHLWRWRDWIVESLNADLPYDEMLRLMLAADERHPNDPDTLRATGYLARNYFLFNRNQWMDEVVEHVGKGMLGLTFNCAKCHDHKYDPIPQADFYRMRAFFEPYHVRLDLVPGEPNLNRDGLPRAFDGHLDVPTYRFVRGQENQPDTSTVIAPGVPEALSLGGLVIRPVSLPVEAWQPERRAWVFDTYRSAARSKVRRAQAEVASARGNLGAAFTSANPQATFQEAESALSIAEQQAALARAESESLELRIAAMRASWASAAEGGPSPEARARAIGEERSLARRALQAEREVAVARARHALAVAHGRRMRAPDDQRKAAEAEFERAREGLNQAIAKAAEAVPVDGAAYTRLVGAAWTPTRFLDSTKDDPRVDFGPTSTGRRTALAGWITDPRHPLTARVGVNHLWTRHMGVPLVASVFDFGRKGARPTHPGLLDWLACEWVDSGWSMKHLHRLIVTSATYRMSSSRLGGEANAAKDPDNRSLWRREPLRLEGQVVRDAILAHAGTLDLTRGGPSVEAPDQPQSHRRSLYFVHSNNDRNLFLTTFDEAAVKECYRREQSIVPQQALALSNSRLVHDAARRIAERLEQATKDSRPGAASESGTDEAFVRSAFRVLLGFEPRRAEIDASVRALIGWRALPAEGQAALGPGPGARAGLIWALLNHNDFVTVR